MPPLYKVTKAKKEYYVYDDNELEKLLQEIGRDPKPEIQRYKGLGEMSSEQLWQTTMNPETRTMMQVSVEDAMAADEIMSLLMGDKVEPRKEFITMQVLVIGNIPLLYWLNQDWYDVLMHTPLGQALLAAIAAVMFISTAAVIKLTQPIEYRR